MDQPRPATTSFWQRPPQFVGLKKACTLCRQAHAACEGGHPCQRCQITGQEGRCEFLPSRKRGRPPKGTIQFDAPTNDDRVAPSSLYTATTMQPSALAAASAPSFNIHTFSASPAAGQPQAGPTPRKQRRVEQTAQNQRPASLAPLAPRPNESTTTTTTTTTTSPPSSSSSTTPPFPIYLPGSSPSPTSSSSFLAPAPAASVPSLLSKLGFAPAPPHHSPQLLLDTAAGLDSSHAKDGGDISGSVLVLLVDQLRDMRHENRNLREEVRTLNSLHKRAEHRIEEIQEENRVSMERIFSMLAAQQEAMSLHQRISPQPPSADPTALYSRSTTPALPPRMRAITHILPFLADYQLWKESVVVDDLSKPFAALSVGDAKPQNDDCGPTLPIFIYASPSFTHLTGYDLHELLGYPITTLCNTMDNNTRNRVYQFAYLPTKSGVGPVFQTTPIWSTKKQVMDMHARNQFFFDAAGKPKWMIVVVDRYIDSGVRPAETRLASYPASAAVYETDIIYDSVFDEASSSTMNPGSGTSSSCAPSPTDDSPETGSSSNPDVWSENSDEGMGSLSVSGGTENLDDLDALWQALGVPSPSQPAGLLY